MLPSRATGGGSLPRPLSGKFWSGTSRYCTRELLSSLVRALGKGSLLYLGLPPPLPPSSRACCAIRRGWCGVASRETRTAQASSLWRQGHGSCSLWGGAKHCLSLLAAARLFAYFFFFSPLVRKIALFLSRACLHSLSVRLLDLETGKRRSKLPEGHSSNVSLLRFAPSGEVLASACKGGRFVNVYSVGASEDTLLRTVPLQSSPMSLVISSASPPAGGQLLVSMAACCEEGSVSLARFSAEEGSEVSLTHAEVPRVAQGWCFFLFSKPNCRPLPPPPPLVLPSF